MSNSNSHNYNKATLIGNWSEDRLIPPASSHLAPFHAAARAQYDVTSTPIKMTEQPVDYHTTTHSTYIPLATIQPPVKPKLISDKTADALAKTHPELLANMDEKNISLERHLKTSKDLIFPSSKKNTPDTRQSITKSSYQPYTNTVAAAQINVDTRTAEL